MVMRNPITQVCLVKIQKIYTETRSVEYFLKGKITDVYNSKNFDNRLKASFITNDTGYKWGFFRHTYSEEFFELVTDICSNNAIAIINMQHEEKFIRKLAWYKLKYRSCIPIKEKIVLQTQKNRLMN
jgi:hypothetical protein